MLDDSKKVNWSWCQVPLLQCRGCLSDSNNFLNYWSILVAMIFKVLTQTCKMTEFFKMSSARFATTHHLVRWMASISHTVLRLSQRQTWQSFMFHLFLSLYYQVVSLIEYQRRIDALNSEDLRSLCKRLQVPLPAVSAPPLCSTSPAPIHNNMTLHSLHIAGCCQCSVLSPETLVPVVLHRDRVIGPHKYFCSQCLSQTCH